MTLAVLCPGQGAQHPAMLARALATQAGAAVIDAASSALGEDPRAWIDEGIDLHANRIAQPLVCIAALATWTGLRDRLPAPAALAGYSVGELACYGLAGALDAGSLALLARQRAAAMDAAALGAPGNLIAVRGRSQASLSRLLPNYGAYIAIVNGDDAFVIGAPANAVGPLQAELQRLGAQVTHLRVGVASHTPLLSAALPGFAQALAASPLRAPAVPVVASVTGMIVTTREEAVATLAQQLDRTVQWALCLDTLYERGCRVFLELGPGTALSRMVRERFEDAQARSVEEFRDPLAAAVWTVDRLS